MRAQTWWLENFGENSTKVSLNETSLIAAHNGVEVQVPEWAAYYAYNKTGLICLFNILIILKNSYVS